MAIKNLTPFKLWTLQNFPFIAEDFDALTNYEMMCKIVGYLNDVIDVTNKQTDAINEMKTWFDNLDVQDEVDKKLDEMAEDGTLAEIINEEIFSELNNQITTLSKKINNNVKIHFIYRNTQQGDCYVIENGTKVYIVDLGRSTTITPIVDYLVLNNLTKIDGVIITHYHGDHTGGGDALGNVEGFENFFDSQDLDFSNCVVYLPFSDNGSIYNRFIGSARYIPTAETNIKTYLTNHEISYHEVETGEEITINDLTSIKFYNADNTIYNNYYDITEIKDGVEVTVYNNFCSIIELKVDDKYFLGTADIEEKAEEMNASLLHAPDVVKIEHHGINPSTDLGYLNKILVAKYGIVQNTSDAYITRYMPTTNAFNTTNKLMWADDIASTIVIGIDSDIQILSKTGLSNLKQSFNNTLEAINNASIFPDFGVARSLSANDDLNDIVSPNTYKSLTGDEATYSNMPILASFRLFVTRILDSELNERVMQVFVANNDPRIFIRKLTSGGWTTWAPLADRGIGIIIPNSSDLDDYYVAGKYIVGSSANSATITNRPSDITNAPFVLEVEYMHDKRRLRQHLYNNVGEEYVRFMTAFNESTQTPTYTSWYKYTLTEVQ